MELTPEQLTIILPQEPGTSQADGLAGHFILSYKCLFHLHHAVLSISGTRYRVSTVGAYIRDRDRYPYGPYEEIGYKRLYETAVYECDSRGEPVDWDTLEMTGCNDSITATANHYEIVAKYEQK